MSHSLGQMRPLAQGVPRSDGEAAVLPAGTVDVRIEGDSALLHAVLSRCDGSRSVTEIAAELGEDAGEDVRELMSELSKHGALVDCTQAYRIFHSQSSVGSWLGRPIGDQELAALEAETFTPPTATPDGATEPLLPEATSLTSLTAQRTSGRPGPEPRPVSFTELSSVLEAMYGRPAPASTRPPVPSAGALYPLALHVLVRSDTPPLSPGLWWYDPVRGELRLLRSERLETEGLFLEHPVTDPMLERGHPIVFVSADVERVSRKYANRGYRFTLMEAGAALQNAYLQGAALDLPVRAIGGFVDDRAHAFLELPDEALVLISILLGS